MPTPDQKPDTLPDAQAPTTARPDETSPPVETDPAGAVPNPSAAVAPSRAPWWQPHRRLYDWVLALAHHKHATTSLFALSFAESSFFPIPPDVLQIALTLERRDKAWWFAGVSTAGSVLGGIVGYLIGMWAWGAIGPFFFNHVPGFTPEHFTLVQDKYAAHAMLAIVTAAFTPIPYKVFTITAGVFGVALPILIVGSLIGRAARFYLVALIIWKFGPPAKHFVEKYFNWLTLAFMILLVVGVLAIKAMGTGSHADESAGEEPAAQTE